MSSLEMKILKALLYVTTLKEISQKVGLSPQAASYHLKKLVKDKRVSQPKRGTYCLTDEGNHFLKIHQTRRTNKKILKNEQTTDQTFLCITFLKTEKEVLRHIVIDTINGEKNITGAYLAWKTGLSRGWISEIVKRLRNKGLITTADLKTFKVHTPTIAGVQLVNKINAPPPDEQTALNQTTKKQKIQTKPQPLVFEAPVLEGPDIQWITVPMRERKGHYYYDYTAYVQGVESESKRVVQVYVPGFISPDYDKGVYEAFKRVMTTLKILEKDCQFRFGHPKLLESNKELVITRPSKSNLQMWVRPHEYLVQTPIVEYGKPEEEWQTYRMKGWDCTWVKDVDGNVMLTPKSAMINVPPLTMKTPDLATYEVQKNAENLIKRLEASQYAFSESMEPKKGSIAIVNDPFALYAYENIESLDEKDLSSGPLKIDKSTGLPELESTDPKKCSIDIGNIWDFYEGIAGGSIDLDELKKVADGNPQLVKLLTLILEYQAVFSKNLITHVEAVKDIKEATENLKEAVNSLKYLPFRDL